MTFYNNFFRSLSNSSNIFSGQIHGFDPHSARSAQQQPAMAQSGTLSRAELQRIVADMVG